MKNVLFPKELKGLWAAIPTPFDRQGRLALDTLKINVGRYTEVPLDGVYTTDSDGEFYALELEEFKQLISTFSQAMQSTDMAVSVGVTWSNTAGIIDRIKVCLDNGISSVHVAFPYWMPLSCGDMLHFWEDLAKAAPDARWIHYNTGRAHKVLNGSDYATIYKYFPENLIGSKLGSFNFLEIADCIGQTPQLGHLAVDYTTVPAMMLGARGTCSYWANTLPFWTRQKMDLCLLNRWEEGMQMQKRLLIWESRYTSLLRKSGYLHGVIGKARSALTGFLKDSGYTRPPYYPVSQELFSEFKQAFEQYWSGEIKEHQEMLQEKEMCLTS